MQQNIKSIWVPALICGFCMQSSDFRTRLTSLYGSQTSSVVLSTHNSVLSTRINRLYWFQPSPVVLCIQNSDFRTRITSLYGSQTWPVILCMYNSVISIRINNLYGSQPSSVDYACKTTTFGQDLKVSKGTRSHLSFCARKTACLASESLVSMGPSPHVRFLDAKQRLMD